MLTAQPPTTQTAQTPQSSSTNTATAMSQFKKMCDSGMFTKGIYANQPLYQQQCDITFPKGDYCPGEVVGEPMKKTILAIVLMLVPMAAFAQDSAWDYSTKNSLSGKSTEFCLRV